jgi:hypothetical protein
MEQQRQKFVAASSRRRFVTLDTMDALLTQQEIQETLLLELAPLEEEIKRLLNDGQSFREVDSVRYQVGLKVGQIVKRIEEKKLVGRFVHYCEISPNLSQIGVGPQTLLRWCSCSHKIVKSKITDAQKSACWKAGIEIVGAKAEQIYLLKDSLSTMSPEDLVKALQKGRKYPERPTTAIAVSGMIYEFAMRRIKPIKGDVEVQATLALSIYRISKRLARVVASDGAELTVKSPYTAGEMDEMLGAGDDRVL